MLVLSRKTDQRILIGGNIEICIVAIRGNLVRVGITAPDNVSIHRSEIADRLKKQGIVFPDLEVTKDGEE